MIGWDALDFANTLYGRTDVVHEYLFNYCNPVLWNRYASISTPQIRQCDRCDWLFVNRSRNRKWHWCSLSAGENQVKVARRYEHEKLVT